MRSATPLFRVIAVPGLDPGIGHAGANSERSFNVTPAKAGVQRLSGTPAAESLDPRFRGDDTASGGRARFAMSERPRRFFRR